MRVLCALLMSLVLVTGIEPKAAKSGSKDNTRFFGGPPSAHGPALVPSGLGGHGSFGGPPSAHGPALVPSGLGGHGSHGGRPPIGGPAFGQPGLGHPAFGGVNPGFSGGAAHHGGSSSSRCRYWCKTPEGAAYCCENTNQPTNPIATQIVKPGRCPPVRPACPKFFGPPVTCSNDGACGGVDKCCFDRCLEEHVCKAPIEYGL